MASGASATRFRAQFHGCERSTAWRELSHRFEQAVARSLLSENDAMVLCPRRIRAFEQT